MEILNQLIGLITMPIPQDGAYHQFCDQRSLFFIPNFMDVVSNGVFLWAGLKGIRFLKTMDMLRTEPVHKCWRIFFYSIIGVSLGSTYYHWHPDNMGLFVDRLPMAIAFMALLAALVTERIDRRLGMRLLPALILLGAASPLYWIYTEYQGVGDLRLYGLVQYGGILALILVTLLGDVRAGNQHIIVALGLYGLAKLMEFLDCQVFEATSYWISGHTLKHVFAGLASYALYRHMKAYTNRF